MKHAVKIPLETSDMFISSITDEDITYTIRDKETGKLIESELKSKYKIQDDVLYFDSRYIHSQLAERVRTFLKN